MMYAAPGRLTLVLGGQRRELTLDEVAEVVVWRGPDGVRRYRMRDGQRHTVALLVESAWSTPTGRLTPVLEHCGWSVTSIDAPADGEAQPAQMVSGGSVTGGSRWRWTGARPVVGLLLLAWFGVLVASRSTAYAGAQRVAGAVAVVAALAAVVVLLVGRRRAARLMPPALAGVAAAKAGSVSVSVSGAAGAGPTGVEVAGPAGVEVARPRAGVRAGWRSGAGIGRATLADGLSHVVLWDGWGRLRVLAATGPAAPASVALTRAGDVVVMRQAAGPGTRGGSPGGAGRAGDVLLRLVGADWGSGASFLNEVATACGLPVSESLPGSGPGSGSVSVSGSDGAVRDPPPPVDASALVWLACALTFLGVLPTGLFLGRAWSPTVWLWAPAVAGLVVSVVGFVRGLVRRRRAASRRAAASDGGAGVGDRVGAGATAVPDGSGEGSVLAWYPLGSVVVLIAIPLICLPVTPPEIAGPTTMWLIALVAPVAVVAAWRLRLDRPARLLFGLGPVMAGLWVAQAWTLPPRPVVAFALVSLVGSLVALAALAERSSQDA